MRNKNKTIFLVLIIAFFVLSPATIFAADTKIKITPPKINVGIPDLPEWETLEVTAGEVGSMPWIADYIVAIYKYAIVIGAIIAVLVLMLGGILLLTAGGAPGNVKKARSVIFSAVSGLAIILFAHLILNIINPNLVELGSLQVETVKPVNPINESEFGAFPANLVNQGGDLPYFSQFDKRWGCFPFTGNECSYQVNFDDNGTKKSLACGTKGFSVNFKGITDPPEKGITACRNKDITYDGMNYCEWLEKNWNISDMCNHSNMKDSAWCENNPYGINNFVEYCKNVSAKNKTGGAANLNTIHSSGCGLTSSAMVLNYYGISATPASVAKWIMENGIRSPKVSDTTPPTCCGFEPVGFAALAKSVDLKFKKLSTSKDNNEVLTLLKKNIPLIFHVSARNGKGSCKFTDNGHYIVVKSYDGSGTFGIHDPSHSHEDKNGGNARVATTAHIWEDCNVHTVSYYYQNFGEVPNLVTADEYSPNPSNQFKPTGEYGCTMIPDYSPWSNKTGCYGSPVRNCSPNDIREIAIGWGNTNILTAPNSCAKMTSRILKNAGCAIPGATWIRTFKNQLASLNWKALVIGGGIAKDYPNQIPIGVLFKCNSTGSLQHVYTSIGNGDIVESATTWVSGCNSKCSLYFKNTCGKTSLPACTSKGYIPGLTPLAKCNPDWSKNQCVMKKNGVAYKATVVIFPTLGTPADEELGCCKSDVIARSKSFNKKKLTSGIRTSQATCDSLNGTWTSGGSSCPKPLSPLDAISKKGLVTNGLCTGAADQNWIK